MRTIRLDTIVALLMGLPQSCAGIGSAVAEVRQADAGAARWDDRAPRLDEASYNRVLERRHFDLTRDELIALGKQEYRRIEAEMTALAKQIDRSKTWQDILQNFERTSHPRTLQDVLPAYAAEIRRARAFMLERDLVTFPFSSEMSVREAPKSLNVAYAMYVWKDDVLLVKLTGAGGDPKEALQTNNDGLIAVSAIHEGYPGHRVQNLITPGNVTSEDSETFTEGWGLYAEELMLRAGYYEVGPAARKLFALRMLLLRAARAFLDPSIHRGDLSPEQAIEFLTDKVGVSADRARVEVTGRYMISPGSAATYLVGKRQIEQLRRQVKAQEGNRFTLKRFHDRLLAQGGVPVQTIARRAFAIELDKRGLLQSDQDPPGRAGSTTRFEAVVWPWCSIVLLAGWSVVARRGRYAEQRRRGVGAAAKK